MSKRRFLSLSFLLFILSIMGGCAKPDPSLKPLVIVSADTLTAGDLEGEFLAFVGIADSAESVEYDSLSQAGKDSLKNVLVHRWIDRKLVLRHAKSHGIKLDTAREAQVTAFVGDSGNGATIAREMMRVVLYLPEVLKENAVTEWDAKQYVKKRKEEKGDTLSLENARAYLEKLKLAQCIRGFRKQGGFRILDPALNTAPPEIVIAEPASGSASASLETEILRAIFPSVDREVPQIIAKTETSIEKGEVDTVLLAEIGQLFTKRKTKPKVVEAKKESRAHLFRPAESLKKAIDQYIPRIQEDYKLDLKRNPNLVGKVIIRIVIDEDGTVAEATIAQSEISDLKYLEKLTKMAKEWKFPKIPKGSGDMVVNYPIDFTPEK